MPMLRKNITISEEDYQAIKDFSKKTGISFSELISKGALHYIKEVENMDLVKFIKENCSYVSDEEQNEFEEFIKNYDATDRGEELTIEDIYNL